MTLTTLTLDQIPLLTDEECDGLHAELSGWIPPTREEAIEMVAQDVIRARIDGGDEGMHWVADVVAEIESRPRAYADEIAAKQMPSRVCHPDCPASVIEGLLGLVERFTGVKVDIYFHAWSSAGSGRGCIVRPTYLTAAMEPAARALTHFSNEMGAARAYRHLAHACLCAAGAACVVLGRKG